VLSAQYRTVYFRMLNYELSALNVHRDEDRQRYCNCNDEENGDSDGDVGDVGARRCGRTVVSQSDQRRQQ
jgi:hypothetical protein